MRPLAKEALYSTKTYDNYHNILGLRRRRSIHHPGEPEDIPAMENFVPHLDTAEPGDCASHLLRKFERR